MPLNEDIAIRLTNVSKKYTIHHEKPTLAENVLSRKKNEEFWALKDINLEIKKGERVGIIGSNGSGKTTLLEIIAGITTPTEGEVYTNGKLVSLIELEAGFHPELTGEENIYLNGLLVGMSKEEIRRKLKKIINFADIGQFIDAPFYTYSSGMALRLAFSIAIHADPDILLLDENISVGDDKFKKATVNKARGLFRIGKTIITVSHDLKFVRDNCDIIFWLNKGRIVKKGGLSVISGYKRS